MQNSLEKSGLPDTRDNNEAILQHLLEVGQNITAENRIQHRSELSAPNGRLVILSTWTILPDGKAYLSTLNIIPPK